jgi:catechol 2,3-dioxygenase-like lactoylglutathione lyase family enzyme
MPKGIAFIATADAKTARPFYENVLGLRLIEEHEFAIVFDAFGTELRIQKAAQVVVAPYTAFGLDVEGLDAWVDKLAANGVSGVRYPYFEQDERAIWTAPSRTRVFWFHDPDQNLISLSEFSG